MSLKEFFDSEIYADDLYKSDYLVKNVSGRKMKIMLMKINTVKAFTFSKMEISLISKAENFANF